MWNTYPLTCSTIFENWLTPIFQRQPSAQTVFMAVSGNLVLSQRIIYSLGDEIRGRLNGIFMAVFFIGGAIGSAVGGFTYAYGSWPLAAAVGIGMVLIALLYYFTEKNT